MPPFTYHLDLLCNSGWITYDIGRHVVVISRDSAAYTWSNAPGNGLLTWRFEWRNPHPFEYGHLDETQTPGKP